MKPFDLEAAKRGEPIQCCGLSAKFIAHVPEAASYEQVLYLAHGNQVFAADYKGGGSHHHLAMAPQKRILWVNVYPNLPFSHHYETLELANNNAMQGRIGGKAYPVEIEE